MFEYYFSGENDDIKYIEKSDRSEGDVSLPAKKDLGERHKYETQ